MKNASSIRVTGGKSGIFARSPEIMIRRMHIVIVLVCLLGVAAWHLHGWIDRREATRMNVQRGRETARAFIDGGYLRIEIGQGKAWRPIYERLLSERFGLKFYHPPSESFCGCIEINEAMESAMKKVMDEEVARRFEPGQLERIAKEAETIYRNQQMDGMRESKGEFGTKKPSEAEAPNRR